MLSHVVYDLQSLRVTRVSRRHMSGRASPGVRPVMLPIVEVDLAAYWGSVVLD